MTYGPDRNVCYEPGPFDPLHVNRCSLTVAGNEQQDEQARQQAAPQFMEQNGRVCFDDVTHQRVHWRDIREFVSLEKPSK